MNLTRWISDFSEYLLFKLKIFKILLTLVALECTLEIITEYNVPVILQILL